MAISKVTRKAGARLARPSSKVPVEDTCARVERMQEELGALRLLTAEEMLRSVDPERRRALLVACDTHLLGAVEHIAAAWRLMRTHLAGPGDRVERPAA